TEAMHETVTVIGDRETNGDFAGPEATQVEIDRVVSEKVRDWMNQAKTIEGQSMHMNRRQDKAAMSNLGFRLRAFTTLSILGQRDYPDVASADAARATVEGVFSDLYTYAPDYKTKTPTERQTAIDTALQRFDTATPDNTAANTAATHAANEAEINTSITTYEGLQDQVTELQNKVARDTVKDAVRLSKLDRFLPWRRRATARGQESAEQSRQQLAEVQTESARLQLTVLELAGEVEATPEHRKMAMGYQKVLDFNSNLEVLGAVTDTANARGTKAERRASNEIYGHILGRRVGLADRYNGLSTRKKLLVGAAGMGVGIAAGMFIGPGGAALVTAALRSNMMNSSIRSRAGGPDEATRNALIAQKQQEISTAIAGESNDGIGGVSSATLEGIANDSAQNFQEQMNNDYNRLRNELKIRIAKKAGIALVSSTVVGAASHYLEAHGAYDWVADKFGDFGTWLRDDVIPDGWAEHLPGGHEAIMQHTEHGLNTTPSDIENIMHNHSGGSDLRPDSPEWNRVMDALHNNEINHADIKSIQEMIPPGLTEEQKVRYFSSFYESLNNRQAMDFGRFMSAAVEHDKGGGGSVSSLPEFGQVETMNELVAEHGRASLFDVGAIQGHMPSPEVTDMITQAANGGSVLDVINHPDLYNLPPGAIDEYIHAQDGFEGFMKYLLHDGVDKDDLIRQLAEHPENYFRGNDAALIQHWLEAYSVTPSSGLTLAA
ncbi:hypothetical protein KBB17_04500, partial [Candidatus Saccharibacteria bacterium]|nr:hypothetical protein [Candidatus Saccharibacteria bacterium]